MSRPTIKKRGLRVACVASLGVAMTAVAMSLPSPQAPASDQHARENAATSPGAAAQLPVETGPREADPGRGRRLIDENNNEDDGGIASCGSNQSCFIAHPTPGCNIRSCCLAVCQADPFCCNTQWDNFCVGTANQLCATCGGPGAGSCYSSHPNPACNDEECCEMICANDSFCCQTAWDNICAGAANQTCTCGGLGTGDCFTPHSTPWCNNTPCCNAVCPWNPDCCDIAWDEFCVFDANHSCSCGGAFTGSCFHAHSTAWCRRGECCNEVCAADSFCCNDHWDSICVGGAFQLCCFADVAPLFVGDGEVNVDDLLAVINGWGPCPFGNCTGADIYPNGGNDIVNVDDLLRVINNWGPCD